jgi:hypothetical protein
MAFKDSFHEVVPGYRINGNSLVFVIRGVKTGGVGAGSKTLEIGNINVASRSFIENADPDNWPVPNSYLPVADIDALYQSLELAGLSTVVDGVLVNPVNVSLLEYDDNSLTADAAGNGGRFNFLRSDRAYWEREGDTFLVPDGEFDEFKSLALARLSTAVEIVGEAANSYIVFDGSNDYVEFSGTSTGLLDWTESWTVGITLVDFEIKSDAKFVTLFKSGSNAIMLRRGGSNHGLYITGNDGATKVGANTWYAPNPGGKLMFSFDATSSRLKYYIGNVDGTFNLRANYFVNTASIGGNTPGSEFCIGKRVGNNAVAESLNYKGGLNNFVYADEAFGQSIAEEYFGVNNVYDEAGFYADLNSWVKMGEDTYPDVVDTLGALSGGALIDGTPEDFVEIPD